MPSLARESMQVGQERALRNGRQVQAEIERRLRDVARRKDPFENLFGLNSPPPVTPPHRDRTSRQQRKPLALKQPLPPFLDDGLDVLAYKSGGGGLRTGVRSDAPEYGLKRPVRTIEVQPNRSLLGILAVLAV